MILILEATQLRAHFHVIRSLRCVLYSSVRIIINVAIAVHVCCLAWNLSINFYRDWFAHSTSVVRRHVRRETEKGRREIGSPNLDVGQSIQ
jgi:hypothetical protein